MALMNREWLERYAYSEQGYFGGPRECRMLAKEILLTRPIAEQHCPDQLAALRAERDKGLFQEMIE